MTSLYMLILDISFKIYETEIYNNLKRNVVSSDHEDEYHGAYDEVNQFMGPFAHYLQNCS